MSYWGRYVPVAERQAKARRAMDKLRKKGRHIQPIEIQGRLIARSFWGKGWCEHLESFSDYANRLPRGRTYVRNGSVCHLEIQPGCIEAMVSGSKIYHVSIRIATLKKKIWKMVKQQCAGQIGSLLELLKGQLSDQVMTLVTHRSKRLFPQPGEIKFDCDCPDWASMCKHVAATLYGVGSRLDDEPALLFLLRGVDAAELVDQELALPLTATAPAGDTLADERLSDIFGIDLEGDTDEQSGATQPKASGKKKAPKTKSAGNRKKKAKVPQTKTKPSPRKAAGAVKPARPPKATPSLAQTRPLPKIRPTGKSVARLRRRLELSVSQFADKLEVTPATIYRWEAADGRLNLRARPLKALAVLQQASK